MSAAYPYQMIITTSRAITVIRAKWQELIALLSPAKPHIHAKAAACATALAAVRGNSQQPATNQQPPNNTHITPDTSGQAEAPTLPALAAAQYYCCHLPEPMPPTCPHSLPLLHQAM
mmetsp:Transcript_38183/g.96650  ORF Transcript_38183/g.96650 Transcript_38183/m.96650 type:complete len:117 (+) Transcript_38183:191-541(+)